MANLTQGNCLHMSPFNNFDENNWIEWGTIVGTIPNSSKGSGTFQSNPGSGVAMNLEDPVGRQHAGSSATQQLGNRTHVRFKIWPTTLGVGAANRRKFFRFVGTPATGTIAEVELSAYKDGGGSTYIRAERARDGSQIAELNAGVVGTGSFIFFLTFRQDEYLTGERCGKITAAAGGTSILTVAPQVERMNVVGTISTAGNAKSVVTASGMGGSPKTVTFAVALNDTATQVAAKMVTALNADADVGAFFTASSNSTTVYIVKKTPAADDATMNFTIDNDTCAGLTTISTSTNDQPGSAPFTAAMIGKATIVFDGATLVNQRITAQTTTTLTISPGIASAVDYTDDTPPSNRAIVIYDAVTVHLKKNEFADAEASGNYYAAVGDEGLFHNVDIASMKLGFYGTESVAVDMVFADMVVYFASSLDYIPDGHVYQRILTTGTETYSDWTQVGSANNWDNLNELALSPDDTNYIKSTSSGNRATFNFSSSGQSDEKASTLMVRPRVELISNPSSTSTALTLQFVTPGEGLIDNDSYAWNALPNSPSGPQWENVMMITGHPSTGAALWADDTMNNMEIGFKDRLNLGVEVRIMTVIIYVDYLKKRSSACAIAAACADDIAVLTDDTWVESNAPTTNKGTDTNLSIGFTDLGKSGSTKKRTLLQFGTADVGFNPPVGEQYDQVELQMWTGQAIPALTIRREERDTGGSPATDWVETTVVWGNDAAPEETKGLIPAGGDETLTPTDNYTTVVANAFTRFDQKTQWNDARDNQSGKYRVMIRAQSESGSSNAGTVHSSDHATVHRRPVIAITYEPIPAAAARRSFAQVT